MSDSIRCKQFIYGRFRADAFGLRNNGYGLLAHSPDLDPVEIETTILPLIKCSPEAVQRFWKYQANSPSMYLYGRLPDGQHVIATLLIRQDIERLDSTGRECPIYHVLLIQESEMKRIGFNPFRVIGGSESALVASVHELHERKEQISEEPWHVVDVSVSDADVEELDWPESELKKLLDFRFWPIKVGGSHPEILSFVQQLHATPFSRQRPLFFTTIPNQENRLEYCLQAGSRHPEQIFVDVSSRKIHLPKSLPQAKTPTAGSQWFREGMSVVPFFFESWLKSTTEKSWQQCLQEFPTVRVLKHLTNGAESGTATTMDDLNEPLIRDFWRDVAPRAVRAAIQRRMDQGVSPDLARALVFHSLGKAAHDFERILYTQDQRKMMVSDLLLECYSWLRENPGALDRVLADRDWQWIAEKAAEAGQALLWFVAISLGALSEKDRPKTPRLLSKSETEQLFRDFPQISIDEIWRTTDSMAFVLDRPAEQWTDLELLALLQRIEPNDLAFMDEVMDVLGLRISAMHPSRLKSVVQRHPAFRNLLPGDKPTAANAVRADIEDQEPIRDPNWLDWLWRRKS